MAFLPNIGVLELVILLVVVVLIFGPKRLPAAARSLGQGMRNFRSSVSGKDKEVGSGTDEQSELDSKAETKTKTEA